MEDDTTNDATTPTVNHAETAPAITATKPKVKGKVGRPRVVLDFDVIEECANQGMTLEQTAAYLRIHPATLAKYKKADIQRFTDTVKRGRAKWAHDLMKHARNRAMKNDAVLMFSLKQLGWSDQRHVEHGGNVNFTVGRSIMHGDAPIPVEGTRVDDE